MIWVLIVVVAVMLIAAFLAMLAGRLSYDGLSAPVHSAPAIELPADAGPDDIAALHFDTALRGYRMDQVDVALRTLQKRIADLEEQVPLSATPAAETTVAETTVADPTHIARHSRRED
ncbi:MAG: DivIVA domain-containing protein [Dermatophilaceae bacterium]|nr:DivIVA domain-containing protein [Intrasporangiaceae bacterium]